MPKMDMFKDWYLILNGVDRMELIVKNSLHCLIISTRADAQLVQEQIDKKIIKNQKIKKSKNQKYKNTYLQI